MKDLYQVLHQKEMDLARVRKEIETLHSIIPLLAEDKDRPGGRRAGLPLSRGRAPEDRYENLAKTNESAETA